MKNKIKPNRRPFFRFVKGILRIFKRKPRFVYTGEKPQGPCIYISNHSAASGPLTYELYFPENMRFWGTYEMCGNAEMRRKYLKDTYFGQKKKYGKARSAFCTFFACPFMGMFYKGMQIMPTYPDFRLAKTIQDSIDEIEKGVNIIIFPENSSDGYHDVLKDFFGGFWLLAKRYHDMTGKDIRIVDMYYSRKKNLVVVGEPRSYEQLARTMSRKQATEFFLNEVNGLYFDHIKDK